MIAIEADTRRNYNIIELPRKAGCIQEAALRFTRALDWPRGDRMRASQPLRATLVACRWLDRPMDGQIPSFQCKP